MPIASPQSDAELLQLILQSKPHSVAAQSQLVANYTGEGGACGSDLHGISPGGAEGDSEYFSTHSPPILNLSPNLSPSNEHHRTSPCYDLRESTRKRALQDASQRENQAAVHHQASYFSGYITEDVGKSESPSRKRRKTSGGIVDLTNTSPSPPTLPAQCESGPSDSVRLRRRNPSQRRPSGERAHTPRGRRRQRKVNPVLTLADVYKELCTDEGLRICFPRLKQLYELGLLIPQSTAVVERSFSLMNDICTFLRTSTTEYHLDELMRINSCREYTLSEEDYDRIIDIFKNAKERHLKL